jgi:hypothetical protein
MLLAWQRLLQLVCTCERGYLLADPVLARAGHAALCLKEVDGLLDVLRSAAQRGAPLRANGAFASHAEAVGTLQGVRGLVAQLESKIRDNCSPARHPAGNTQRAEFALQLFGELRVNEDTVDLLMCGAARVLRRC